VRRAIATASLALVCSPAIACHHAASLGPSTPDGGGGAAAGAGAYAPEAGAAGTGGNAGGAAPDAGATPDTGATPDAGIIAAAPGFVGMRLLSTSEYAHALQDLLGLTGLDQEIAATFKSAPDRSGGRVDVFDNGPGAFVLADQYAVYFADARTYVARAFAQGPLRDRIVTCDPATPSDDACTRQILKAFGLRAWRRPLSDDELDALVAVVRADQTAGESFFSDAIAEAVVTMVSSESFLYRIELDPPPPDTTAHPLTQYELASRLSFLLWSTTPDDTLLSLANAGKLTDPSVLAAQVGRLVADPKSFQFANDFFGQWLGFRSLADGTANPPQLVTPSTTLQASVANEAVSFTSDLVWSGNPFGGLLTDDVNFVDGELSKIYGFSPTQAGFTTRIENVGDARAGYLGLAAFFAMTSDPDQSSPADRGRWIRTNLLCQDVPDPPQSQPALPATGTPRQQSNDRLAQANCASCHSLMDPVGLGLESFDQVGRFRLMYADGTPVDGHGALDGTAFEGVIALGQLVAKDPRFSACARRKLLTYALGRVPTNADAARVAAIDAAWTAAGGSVRGLVAALVLDELFLDRHGEGQ
jgi:hypothetical protein